MKKEMKNKMTFNEADKLIERYYEGETSVAEERLLSAFLSQGNLPQIYDADKAIIGFLKPQQVIEQKPRFTMRHYMSWASVAAVLVLGVTITVQLMVSDVHMSYAYIDGQKVTDLSEVKLHAMASIDNLPSTHDIVDENLHTVSSRELVQQQLDLFADFE